jgi:hypothetical protein
VCYVNFGFASSDDVRAGWLPEHECAVRFRIGDLPTIRGEDLRLLDRETLDAMGINAWTAAVEERIATPTAQLLGSVNDPSDLRRLLRDDIPHQRLVTVDGR